jgi:cytochrome c5
MLRIAFVLAAASMAFAACESEHVHEGSPSQATCPTDNSLTYDSFGKGFMDTYCVRCHSSSLKGSARQGAEPGHNYDTLNGILPWLDHIDEHAGAGPMIINTEMPPSGPLPKDDERRKLGQWLACELKKQG